MKTIKVSVATNTQLDWLVAKCEGYTAARVTFPSGMTSDRIVVADYGRAFDMLTGKHCAYATDWSQMGPIIEREKIAIDWDHDIWNAAKYGLHWYIGGPTMLIAAARCFIVSKLGEIVEVPEELS